MATRAMMKCANTKIRAKTKKPLHNLLRRSPHCMRGAQFNEAERFPIVQIPIVRILTPRIPKGLTPIVQILIVQILTGQVQIVRISTASPLNMLSAKILPPLSAVWLCLLRTGRRASLRTRPCAKRISLRNAIPGPPILRKTPAGPRGSRPREQSPRVLPAFRLRLKIRSRVRASAWPRVGSPCAAY